VRGAIGPRAAIRLGTRGVAKRISSSERTLSGFGREGGVRRHVCQSGRRCRS
jgi:hypothetical protein